jgi:hypothetical protein
VGQGQHGQSRLKISFGRQVPIDPARIRVEKKESSMRRFLLFVVLVFLVLTPFPAQAQMLGAGSGGVVVSDPNGVPADLEVNVGGSPYTFPLDDATLILVTSGKDSIARPGWVLPQPDGSLTIVTQSHPEVFRVGTLIRISAPPESRLSGTYALSFAGNPLVPNSNPGWFRLVGPIQH